MKTCERCAGKGWELVTTPNGEYRGICLGCYGRGDDRPHTQTIMEKIQQRRYQMLVHSYLYYELGESIVSDYHFDMWAKELVVLQESYPKQSEMARYHEAFIGFDGSSGFDLPYDNPEIQEKAHKLLQDKRGKENGTSNLR